MYTTAFLEDENWDYVSESFRKAAEILWSMIKWSLAVQPVGCEKRQLQSEIDGLILLPFPVL